MMRAVIFLIAGLGAMAAQASDDFIILQSTTSTDNSGLFMSILPEFQAETGIEVRVVAVGTGQALRNGAEGNADVLLVHAKKAEEDFVAAGFGTARFDVMYNDFVIVGPAEDPAGIMDAGGVHEALTRIANAREDFVSRGDDSGTHKAELRLWETAGVDAQASSGKWYKETGQGMGATLNIARGLGGYAISDRATWISFGNKGAHRIVFEGDAALFNQYGVIEINADRHPHVKSKAARAFIDWLLSDAGQNAIAAFEIDGQQLFFPNASD